MSDSGSPASPLDPFSPEFLADPYPFLAQLRAAGPVVWLQHYGVWGLPRHAEVHDVLNDWATFCSSRGVGLGDFHKQTPWRAPSLILEADPPLHSRMRAVLSRVVSPTALRRLRGAFEAEAERLVEHLSERGRFDGVADLAEAYPLKVFPDAMGLSIEGRENLLPYGSLAFNAFGPDNQILRDAMRDAEPVIAWIMAQCRAEALSPGSLGAELFAGVGSGDLSEQEAPFLMRSFLTAGVDTTVAGIAATLLAFARRPDQWRLLREDPSLVRNAFEEVLRLESPVQTFFRTCTRDVEIAGVQMSEGDKVLMFLASANRDDRRWEDPDRLDIRRRCAGHVAFGLGIHGCVGQMLARLEAESVLAALARRIRTIELAGPPRWRLNNTLRGLSELPLRVSPA